MSEVRSFRWLSYNKNPQGYGPGDGFDYDVQTGEVHPVKGEQRFLSQEGRGLALLIGLIPDLETLERWVANQDDDFSEVTV